MTGRSAFDRLHAKVKHQIYDLKWPELRPIQVDAIHHLLDEKKDIIISAPTASGKTEAAFLPIISEIAEDFERSVRALYVGPLKALINDQFRRAEGLCERLQMPVHRWHGDVGESARARLKRKPSGILLITPESLEAMFLRRSAAISGIFSALDYIVIDEIHAFIGSVRGAQLLSLLWRLERIIQRQPVRVGLSATIGEPARACLWLRPGAKATLIQDDDSATDLAIRVRGFWDEKPPTELNTATEPQLSVRWARAIWEWGKNGKNLVFANAKGQIEEVAAALMDEARVRGIQDDVIVHHGSLSKEERERSELLLQKKNHPTTAVCSNTLELGIDVGDIDRVLQVSAPWSVSSLRQRVGRSGRRGDRPAILLGLFAASRGEKAEVWRDLQLNFLQGIATVELMIGDEKFVEPPSYDNWQLSTLVQQTLSSLAVAGGMSAVALYPALFSSGAFRHLSQTDFAIFLRGLHEKGLIEQLSDGTLLVAPKGERVVNHWTFYAAFKTPEEFTVIAGQNKIGSLPEEYIPPRGHVFLLSGKKWRVLEVDHDNKAVLVARAPQGLKPVFGSSGGAVHRRIHEKMCELLGSPLEYSYLDEVALEILQNSQNVGQRFGALKRSWQRRDGNLSQIFLWGGSHTTKTFYLAFIQAGLMPSYQEIGLEVRAEFPDVKAVLQKIARKSVDPVELAVLAEEVLAAKVADAEKFDWAVASSLWTRAWAAARLDMSSAAEIASEILGR